MTWPVPSESCSIGPPGAERRYPLIMVRDERLRKVQDAGADLIEAARAKAEEFLRELSRAGEGTQGRAQDALEDLVESGRKGTEQLAGAIRREIQSQLAALGLATKADLAELEQRLSGHLASPSSGVPAAPGPAGAASPGPAAARTAPPKKAAARKAPGEKAAAKKVPAKKAAAKKAAATRPTGASGSPGATPPEKTAG